MRCPAYHPTEMQTVAERKENGGAEISKQRVQCWHGKDHEGRHGNGAIVWGSIADEQPEDRA